MGIFHLSTDWTAKGLSPHIYKCWLTNFKIGNKIGIPSNIPKSSFYNTIFPKLYLAMEVVVLLWVVSVSNNNKILSCTAFTWHPYKRVFAQRKNTSMVNDSLMIFLSRLLACRHTVLQDRQFTALKKKFIIILLSYFDNLLAPNPPISVNFLKMTLC